jgi:hypothetical protein
MNCVHIIGNGESRKNFDFSKIKEIKIGCNAAYRDIELDYLVAVDRRMVDEAIRNNFQKPIYTRQNWMNNFIQFSNVNVLPKLPYTGELRQDDPWHWGSGPHACNLAATMSPNEIHLWGFDLWGNNGKVNNVYKGTNNYDPVDKNFVDPRYWIYQIAQCFKLYPNISWIQHQLLDWQCPKEWTATNLTIIRHNSSIIE